MPRTRSLAPIAGLTFGAALLAGTLFGPSGPSSNDPASGIAAYYAHHAAGDVFSDYTSVVASAALLVVFCASAARIRGTAGAYLLAAAGAGLVFELGATAIEMALAANVHDHAPAATTAALYQVASRLFLFSTLALGGAVALASIGEARAWLAWLARIAGALLVTAGLGAAHPHGHLELALLPGWTLLLVWGIAWSIAAIRSPERTATPTLGYAVSSGER
jgi:hypothetical protein